MVMSDSRKSEPAVAFMLADIVSKILAASSDIARLSEWLSNEIRELTGARIVLIVTRQSESSEYVVSFFNPERKKESLGKDLQASLIRFSFGLNEIKILSAEEMDTDSGVALKNSGFEINLFFPLTVDHELYGSIIALGLPTKNNIELVRTTYGNLTSLLGLVLKNAYMINNQEIIIQRRTKEIEENRVKLEEQNIALKNSIAQACESELRLRLAASSGKLGIWDWDVKENKMTWDKRMFEIYQADRNSFTGTVIDWTKALHPEDKEKAIRECDEALKGNCEYDTIFRILHPDGTLIYIKAEGQVIRDEVGNPVRMVGINKDISQQRKIEEDLVEYKNTLEAIISVSPLALTMLDLNGKVRLWNKAAEKIFGWTYEEILGQDNPLIPPGKSKEYQQWSTEVLSGLNIVNQETERQRKDGSMVQVNISSAPIKNNQDEVIGRMAIFSDITEKMNSARLLQEKSREIEAQNEEYRQINEELVLAKDRAEESDRLKTAFLQNMSHEIRTPMNAIMGFSELLFQQANDHAKLKKYTGIIQQRSKDLLDIINDLLDIAKIESGQLPVHIEEFKLKMLFSDLALFFNEYKSRIGKSHVRLNLTICPELEDAIILSDKGKLRQIFVNLITNAFKFTERGTVTAGCLLDSDQRILYFVSDTGIGIPAEKQTIIFNRFTQLQQEVRNTGGTGLGLAIVKGLVNLLGGEISLESSPGAGSKFSFKLPYQQAKQADESDGVKQMQEKRNLENKTILLVEDDPFNAEYLTEILTLTSARILHTAFGKEAVDLALANKPDLILMDIRLPDIDGYTAAAMILKEYPAMKIIAQTAYASTEEGNKAKQMGCVDYISKPTLPDQLLTMLHRHLGNNTKNDSR